MAAGKANNRLDPVADVLVSAKCLTDVLAGKDNCATLDAASVDMLISPRVTISAPHGSFDAQ